MFGHHRSTEVVCPHCGASQIEPKGIVSTYCRTCSQHFSPSPRVATRSVASDSPTTGGLFRVKQNPSQEPRVACHACGHHQRAHQSVAEAPCRHCGRMMSYRDIEISSHSTREICTHGRVLVTRKGFLNSTRVRCSSAHVEGRIAGRVDCTGILRLSGIDFCKAQIRAAYLQIDRGADISLIYTPTIGGGVIAGRLLGDIQCTGSLRVKRHGVLLGDVEALALTVDRGGIYSGDVRVGYECNHPNPIKSEKSPTVPDSLWLPGFAFGAA